MLLAIAVALSVARAEEPSTLLIHVSDTHLPVPGAEKTVAALGSYLERASGVVVTGDLTEFGGLDSLAKFERLFSLDKPVVTTLGNHDATWRSLQDEFRKRHRGLFYARDMGSFRVLSLDSSTCQDPRPHWDPAELRWLTSEVESAGGMTLVVAFHHPPWGSEFASPWARARLATALAGAKGACLLTGHSHASSTRLWGGYRVIVGGAAFGDDCGFTTVELVGGELTGIYHPNGKKERVLFAGEPIRAPAPLAVPSVGIVLGNVVVTLAAATSSSLCELTGSARVSLRSGSASFNLAALDQGRGAAPGWRGVVVSDGERGRIERLELDVPGGHRALRRQPGRGSAHDARLVREQRPRRDGGWIARRGRCVRWAAELPCHHAGAGPRRPGRREALRRLWFG